MMTNKQSTVTLALPLIAFIFGVAALLLLIAGVALSVAVEAIGFTSFINPTILLSVLAVVCALVYKSQNTDRSRSGARLANTGFIAGIIALALAVLLRVAVFIYFIPWLAAGI